MNTKKYEINEPVPILGGLYVLNPDGDIKSQHKRNYGRMITSRIDRAGYYTVRLSKAGKTKTYFLHRLLAQAFIPNPFNKRYVNHKNGDKLDISIDNLEWSTHSENIQHAFSTGLCRAPEFNSKKVIDICTGKEYSSIVEAANECGMPYSTCKNILRGIRQNKTCLRLAC